MRRLTDIWLEERAKRISDPVERLRYLRRSGAVISRPRPQRRRWRNSVVWVLVVAAIVMIPGPLPSAGTTETLARERRIIIGASGPGQSASQAEPQKVWRVETSDATEFYSNGLRIDTTFTVANRPRARYPVFSLTGSTAPSKWETTPAGIVFHTSESNLAPFEEDQNRRLRQLAHSLLETIREERAYHYVIDRFGRVFRVVQESDAANHAGFSVWADYRGIYVDLNDSFLAIAFEGQTAAADGAAAMTPAQNASARMLVDMLRSRYRIPAEDCVTHAQVSVNPGAMLIGSHTDWASDFPFSSLGLPDNYSIPLASLYAFGFAYDNAFLNAVGGSWRGLTLATEQVERRAANESLPVDRYRRILERRYKDILSFVKEQTKGDSSE